MDIIFFDGVCNFCNASVNFIIDHDSTRRYRFASLQSELGQKTLQENGYSTIELNTILLLRSGKLYQKSTAALEIARYLKGWSWLYGFILLPRFIRDAVYGLVARNRYRIFGKSESCRIPTPEERSLFIV
ncbi:MAG: thiol-disulfide oxidoreductase DCC family protein [Bacteroidetes bacterium]|nr:thiol-disulfide oxidoreductase DCC family protein [Bacteroidota bacterium]